MKSSSVLSLAVGLAAAVSLVTGCSSFRGDQRAARGKAPVEGSVEGIWEGRWHKTHDPSHGGRMTMVLTKTGDTLYRASTRSQWWRVFTSAYDSTVVLTPVRPGEFIIQGGKNIWPLGEYTLDGRVTGSKLTASYAVGKDTGVIELERPATEPAK